MISKLLRSPLLNKNFGSLVKHNKVNDLKVNVKSGSTDIQSVNLTSEMIESFKDEGKHYQYYRSEFTS
jgi:hypothetical protein